MTLIATVTFTLWLVTSSGTTPVGRFTGPASMAEVSCNVAAAIWAARLKEAPRPVLARMVCGISVDLAPRPEPPAI